MLRYRQRPLGETLRGVEVPPLERSARESTQVIHCEGMLLEAQPPGIGIRGPGGIGGLGYTAGLEPRERLRARARATSLNGSVTEGIARAAVTSPSTASKSSSQV